MHKIESEFLDVCRAALNGGWPDMACDRRIYQPDGSFKPTLAVPDGTPLTPLEMTTIILASRTSEVRSRRWEPAISEAWQPDDWGQRLKSRFPDMLHTGWGIECGVGWSYLIEAACELSAETKNPPTYSDIKQKFGTLRLYGNGGDSMHDLIEDAALELSSHICERCGCPGIFRHHMGWIQTLCNTHYDEWSRR